MIDVERARTETPGVENRIHFNNCGAALMPTPVLKATKAHLDLEAQIGGYEAADASANLVKSTYDAVSRLLNCSRNEVAIVENATRAWDMVFYALNFEPGDRILTCVAEYASNYIAYLHRARKTRVEITVVPNDEYGQLDVSLLERMINKHVKLIAVTHVPTNGGLVNPAAEIGEIAQSHGIPFLLDACQSVGQIPIDVEEMGVDMLSATSRKYLRGPRGVGFLYVRQSWIEKLDPPFLDLHAATWIAPDRFQIRDDARRFECWESNIAAQIGLGVAIDYALQWGLESINQRVVKLAAMLRDLLENVPHIKVQDTGVVQCGIVSFSSDIKAPQEIVSALSERNINVSVSNASSTLIDMKQRGLDAVVRAGVHYYNTEGEVVQFVNEVADIVGK